MQRYSLSVLFLRGEGAQRDSAVNARTKASSFIANEHSGKIQAVRSATTSRRFHYVSAHAPTPPFDCRRHVVIDQLTLPRSRQPRGLGATLAAGPGSGSFSAATLATLRRRNSLASFVPGQKVEAMATETAATRENEAQR